jgi:hypothetical protein
VIAATFPARSKRVVVIPLCESHVTKLTGRPAGQNSGQREYRFKSRTEQEDFMGRTRTRGYPLPQPASRFSYEHEGDRQFATTLARGLEVLRCFHAARADARATRKSRCAPGLPKPTVSRLTYTLTKLGYLRHNMRLGKYQLGSAVLSIGYPLLAVDERAPGGAAADEGARRLLQRLGVDGVRDRLDMVYVESCRSGNGITTLPDIGTRCRSRTR